MNEDQDSKELPNALDPNIKEKSITDEQLKRLGADAEKERDALLKKHPELRNFQKKIDRLMENTDSFDERMNLLGIMMEANLKEIRNRLTSLSSQLKNMKKP